MTDVIVIGGGLNGLVAAAMLARAKRSVVLLDQRPTVGGAAMTTEIAPGFRVPTLSHALGPVSRDVVRALRLDRARGLGFLTPDPSLTTIGDDGRTIVFHRDNVLTAASINVHSPADSGRWNTFVRTTQRLGSVVAALDRTAPPPVDHVTFGERWQLLRVARAARALGRHDLARLARWAPMAVADLVSEWFDTDLLRAAIAACAIAGNPAGPRSAGTGGMWLQRIAGEALPVGSGVTTRGGPGALAAAVAQIATRAGAIVRTGARVSSILTRDGRATGVVLDNGDEIFARAVVAAISPKAALGQLAAQELAPSVAERVRHIRARGVTAKVNLALAAMPVFPSLGGDAVPLRGRILIAPGLDYLERAFDATKYGAMSESPWLELSLPSALDDSLAPAGAHVMSVYAHFAPRELRDGTWNDARERLWSAVLRVLESRAPNLSSLIVAREVLTPEDLEQGWGLPGGHIFHAESTLDQWWVARPLLGWAQYRTPVAGLYLASAGTHPGGGLTGLPGWLASQAVHRDLKRRGSAG